ncbi:MAG: hypothetical protein A2X36_08155 [Elusimicrobia bacterium GWA2_69_24]|nr:MAG: hypothetical protein A2X36_08155 [Elusimicrobia bacterium GWA2_69_24]HBL16901.1 hypothetical protein [Elusimicrobiota bacterium]
MATILVTDDEQDMRLALMNTLEMAGYSVLDAGSGKEALERLKTAEIDLVLLDIRLPDMDGVQILKKIKVEHPGLPVIMCTGFGSLETAVKTVQLGAADYISKPFENKDLFQRIEKALSKRQLKAQSGPITMRLMRELGVEAKAVEPSRDEDSAGESSGGRGTLKKAATALAFLIAAGAGGFFLYQQWLKNAETAFGIPTTHLSGISWDGERLWLSDWFSQTLYQCRQEGKQLEVRTSFHLPDQRPTGIAWSGDALYLSDAWNQKLSKHALNPNLTVVLSTGSPAGAPGGLFWDGTYLWSADSGARQIFRHSGATLLAEKSLAAPGTAPVGISVADGYLWAADADTKRIYRFRVDQDFTPAGIYSHPLLREQTRALSAFLLVGKDVWLGFEGDNKIYRVKIGRLQSIQ